MSEWIVAPVVLTTSRGPHTVAGWVCGNFALDFRAFDYDADDEWLGGWTVTHLPTGYVVRRVVGSLAKAKQFVSLIADANWDFTDPAAGTALSAVVKAAINAIPDCTFYGRVAREIAPQPDAPITNQSEAEGR